MNFKIILPLILIALFGISEFCQIKAMKGVLNCERQELKIFLLLLVFALCLLMGYVAFLLTLSGVISYFDGLL